MSWKKSKTWSLFTKKNILKAALFLFVIFLFLGRLILYYQRPKTYQDGDKIQITSIVTSEPVVYEDSQYIKLKGLRFYLPLLPRISYGDKIIVQGVVEKDRLKDIELINHWQGGNFVYGIRNKLLSVFARSLPIKEASLVAGVVIGSKALIPADFWQVLKKSGTMHVVVASGMNVTIVASFLLNFLVKIINRRKAIIVALVGVWLYAILAGFEAPIVRAAIMGSIAFTAAVLGRVYFALRALILSALLMLFINPGWISDLGFILSFVATLSLILFSNGTSDFFSKFKIFQKLPKIIQTDFSTTISAQIGVVPILLFAFGQVSVWSPLVNTLVLWTIPLITIGGMIGGMLGLIWLPLGRLVLLIIYPLAKYFVEMINLFK